MNVYTVAALTARISASLTGSFPLVWVRGEVTNLTLATSGHIYFSLKDATAQLQCVWFAHKQRGAGQAFDPLTGEVYAQPRPEPKTFMRNGLDLLCGGAIQVYAARGQYQLMVEMAEAAGEGLLALEFARRKAMLEAKGYFASDRKRPLPDNPSKIALITSLRGAAIQDFLKVARDRGLSSRIRLFPVLVQGAEAAAQIAAAIKEANAQHWAEVIVLIRGGGSLEDLWAFNEMVVADVVFQSRLPVLAGIGHEVDTSLADMTADLRAATPTHAAQLLWRPRAELWQRLDLAQMALRRQLDKILAESAREYAHLSRALKWLSPMARLAHSAERLANAQRLLQVGEERLLEEWQRRVLSALDAWRLAPGLRRNLALAEDSTRRLTRAVPQALDRSLALRQRDLAVMQERLEALNPYAPLRRGYALLLDGDKVISHVAQVKQARTIRAMLADGQIGLRVIGEGEAV